jgi:SAM-dependent methyltransferase
MPASPVASALNTVHGALVFNRRVEVLSRHLSEMIPAGGTVLDLGCGDGQIAARVMSRRPDLAIQGVDVLIRPITHIPVTRYDGQTLPFPDKSFDAVTLVDVLHHTDDPAAVLREAVRVARRSVVIKDHLREGVGAGVTLRLMDWVGNRGHGVRLPYNYLSRDGWERVFAVAGCKPIQTRETLDLYPPPLSLVFDRGLHFISLLEPLPRPA